MSQDFGRDASQNSFRAADCVPSPLVSAARVFLADNVNPPIFRSGIRRGLQLHRRMALAFASSGLVFAFAYLIAYWSSYTAQSLIYIQPKPSPAMEAVAPEPLTSGYDQAAYDAYVQQQVLSMTQRDVLVGVLHKLAPGVWQQRGDSDLRAADRLKGSIEVARIGSSDQVSVTAHASNPNTATALANAVAASYIEAASQQQNDSDAELAILRDERDRIKKELDDELSEQASVDPHPGLTAVGSLASRSDDEIERIHEELVKARTEHDEAVRHLTSIYAKNGSSSQSLDVQANALALEQLRADLERTAATENQLNSQLAAMIKSAPDATPKLQRSSDLAGNIARLQNLYSDVDEEFRQLPDNNALGTARLAAAATVPLHPDASKVICNAMALLLVFVFLGAVAVVAAHKLDQRVWIASDVERLLGVVPIAQLPDFGEVSEDTADVHLMRLAAAFDFAAKDGGIKSCVFTGAGPGAGVTTVASRLRDKLGTMGRAAILVDATGSAPASLDALSNEEEATTDPATNPGTLPIAFLQQVTEQEEVRRGELVFADTAPLAVSAETECLARFADCVIVVIESGVTTRTQLRRLADMVQRLNLNAVGFVLNRVRLAKADPAYRNSIDEIEKHLRTQGRFTDWQAIRSRYFMAEPVRVAAEAEIPTDTAVKANESGVANKTVWTTAQDASEVSGQAATSPGMAQEIPKTTWQPDDMPSWLTDALARFEAAPPTPNASSVLTHDPETPLAAEAPGHECAATESIQGAREEISDEPKPHSDRSNGILFSVVPEDQNQAEHIAREATDAVSVPKEPVNSKMSRLGGLRGIASSVSLKDLRQARPPVAQASEMVPRTDSLSTSGDAANIPARQEAFNSGSSRLSRLRGIVSARSLREFGQPKQPVPLDRDSRALQDRVSAERIARIAADPAIPKPPVPAQAFVSYPKPDSSLTGPGGSNEEIDAPKPSPADPEHAPPHLAAETPRSDTWDGLQILPSRRGQYRKTD
jgi:Mrp family chromosome partitioning ATPase/capsular polysaccharide biosynthesis protein